jgi:hypothetical protein
VLGDKRMTLRAYYADTATNFLLTSSAAVVGQLVARHPFAVDLPQRNSWQIEIEHLRQATSIPDSTLLLEFAIPRMGKRADAIVIANGNILVIEYKVGAEHYHRHDLDQVVDYAPLPVELRVYLPMVFASVWPNASRILDAAMSGSLRYWGTKIRGR